MYSYAILEPECYYIIQEMEDKNELTLMQVKLETDNCMYVVKYQSEVISEWKRKSDPIFDIIELIGDEAVQKWSKAYYGNEDAYYEGEDE